MTAAQTAETHLSYANDDANEQKLQQASNILAEVL